MRVRATLAALLLGTTVTPLRAQLPGSFGLAAGPADSEPVDTLPIDSAYAHGWVHRLLLGSDYRRLWAAPVPLPVLDLRGFAGGLRPLGVGGGTQTTSLHLEAADGRRFDFRSVDKTAVRVLPPELRRTIVGRAFQDQVSAYYPVAVLVSTPLLQAAGVRTSPLQLFVMPDDSVLGEFRRRFAGMVGILEERPEPTADQSSAAYSGVRKVIHTTQLYDRLRRDPRERVDVRGFLAARLMDLYLGDNDRGESQWRWLRQDGGKAAPWEPLPVDRDHDFVRYTGLLVDLAYIRDPVLVDFGPRYSSPLRLSWRARFIDRRLLSGLSWTTWDSTARALQTRLADSVIDDAVRRLPPTYYASDGARLARTLRARRDGLPDAARHLYRLLALDAEVDATDASETVTAARGPGGRLDLTIRDQSETPDDPPYFHRTFASRGTKEVRLFLGAGTDTVRVLGTAAGPRLRIIAAADPKVVSDDAAGGWTRVYAAYPGVTVGGTHPPSVDGRRYQVPDSTSAMDASPRDWGHLWRPWAGLMSGDGISLATGVTLFSYGFRRNPYGARFDLRAGYSTEAGAFAGELLGDVSRENSATHLLFQARASGFDVLRFFDFGNETQRTAPADFFKADQQDCQLSAALGWDLGEHLTAQLGPTLRYSTTDFDRPTLISQVRPYGSGRFGELGAEGNIALDTRDTAAAPTRGIYLAAGGSVHPPVWDVTSTFGELHGSAATYLTAPVPLEPTLALRAGGERIWGRPPFQDAASVGGDTTVRGLYTGRFLGDASAYGNAELRLRLSHFYLFLPGEMGLFGLTDVGRVWQDGESSDRWHTAFGGGLWFAYLDRRNTVSVALARGDQRTALYLRTGFMF